MRRSQRGPTRRPGGIVPLCAALVLGLLLAAAAMQFVRHGAPRHALAPGVAWAWGRDETGQLGDGSMTFAPHPLPGPVQGLDGVLALAGGDSYSLALREDGTLWAWGAGPLGSGPAAHSRTPRQVPGLDDVGAVAAGGSHVLALKRDGTVWAWGDDSFGQLGVGAVAYGATPARVGGLAGVRGVAVGGWACSCASRFSVALKADGTVWAWGGNAFGFLGDGGTASSRSPVQVTGLDGVVAIAAGGLHTLALRSDGTVWAWGKNDVGELGLGTTDQDPHPIPTRVSGLGRATAIAAGGGHSLALLADGSIWAWGDDTWGQAAGGHALDQGRPAQVPGLDRVVALAAGNAHSLALKDDGTVWAWGQNRAGQLGDSAVANADGRGAPVQVGGLDGVTAIAAGQDHGLALVSPPFYARTEDTDGRITYSGTWQRAASAAASGGSVTYADGDSSGEAIFGWEGTGLALLMGTGPQMGMAAVVVDDERSYLLDLYSPAPRFRQVVLVLDRLPSGAHQVTVAPSTQKNAYSSGNTVALDAIDVR